MADSPDFRLLEQHADVWHLWVETVLGGGQSQGDAQRFSESRSRALGALTLAAGEVREVRKGSRWALFGAAAVFGLIAGAGAFGGFVAHANITAQAAPEPVAAAATPDDTAALEARIEELATGLSELQFRFDHLAETAYPILGHGYITTDDE